MLVQQPHQNVLKGQARSETAFFTNTNRGSNNNGLHEQYQHAYEVPSAKTEPHLSQCTYLRQTVGYTQKAHIIPREEFHASVNALWNLIEDNPEVRSLFTKMLEQVPNAHPYDKSPTGGPRLRNWKDLLYAFNDQLARGPTWLYDTPGQQGLIGFPFNVLLVRYRNFAAPLLLMSSLASRPAQPSTLWSQADSRFPKKELVNVNPSRPPRLPPSRRQRPPPRHPHCLRQISLFPCLCDRPQRLPDRLAQSDRSRCHCVNRLSANHHQLRARFNNRHHRSLSPSSSAIPRPVRLQPSPSHTRLRLLGRLLHAPLPTRYPTFRFPLRRQRHSQRLRIPSHSARARPQTPR